MTEKGPNCGGPVYPHDPARDMTVFVCPRCTYYELKDCRKQITVMDNKISELQKIISKGELMYLPFILQSPSQKRQKEWFWKKVSEKNDRGEDVNHEIRS